MSRVTCSAVGGTIQCRIKTWKAWYWIIMWPPMSLMWVAAVVDMKTHENTPIILQAIWILFGCVFTYGWFRTVFGKEVVTVSRNRFSIKLDILGIGLTRDFELDKVRNLRTVGPFGPPNMWRYMLLGLKAVEDRQKFSSKGTLAFGYGRKTIRFGPQLKEEEASEVLQKLKEYLPSSAVNRD